MDSHIILIGFMGAGKTTVGKNLARKTGFPLLDTDHLIEEQTGKTVKWIFEAWGEEEFRRLETDVLKTLADRPGDWVLSTGGGLPMKEENRKLLGQAGMVVYLKAEPETVLNRLSRDRNRPLLAGSDRKERVESLMAFWGPVYESGAHVIVKTDGKSPDAISDEIVSALFAKNG